MAYIDGRLVHDADSHLMEMTDCLDPYLSDKLRARLHQLPAYQYKHKMLNNEIYGVEKFRQLHGDPAFRADIDSTIMSRKNYEGHGSFIAADRPHALDLLGVASQLVFTTFCLENFDLNHSDDMELCYATASAHNHMITDFCKVDPRLLPVGYTPLEDFERSRVTAKEAIALGAKALMVPSTCPQHHSPSHIELFPIWEMAQEAGIPIIFHVGGEDKINPTYLKNGLPPVPDFHGGDDNFTAVSYMTIPNAVMQTLTTLIFDGIFDRFPKLKFGAIELGAAWLPGWMRSMDSAAHAFLRNEDRLQNLSAKPSEIARRQLRVTPYPHEDTGWIVQNSGSEMCMFSSDYPHIEGGRNPLKRFDTALQNCSTLEKDNYFSGNFIDFMGEGLAPELRNPRELQDIAS